MRLPDNETFIALSDGEVVRRAIGLQNGVRHAVKPLSGGCNHLALARTSFELKCLDG
jgi:hypothetical protein